MTTPATQALAKQLDDKFRAQCARLDADQPWVGRIVLGGPERPLEYFIGGKRYPDERIVDQAVFGLSKPDGSADPVALAKYLARDPRRAKVLAGLNRTMQTAARLAADAAREDLLAR